MMRRREIRDLVRRIMSGEELILADPRQVRWVARELGRQRRKRVFIGRDKRNNITKISLL